MKLSNTIFSLGNQALSCKQIVVDYLSVLADVFVALLPTTLDSKQFSEEKVLALFEKLGEIRNDFSFMEESEIAVKLSHLKEILSASSAKYKSSLLSNRSGKLDEVPLETEKALEKP